MRTTADYLDKITSFWRGKPKFTASVGVTVAPMADLQAFFLGMPLAFDLDTSVGVQEDAVGEWVGRSRRIPIPIPNAYFSFDTAGLGFDEGVWQGPYSPAVAIDSLDDESYRQLLYAKIAANNCDGDVDSVRAIYAQFFGSQDPDTLVFLEDKSDMSYVVGVAGKLPSVLFQTLLTGEFLPLKPSTVQVFYAITSVDRTALFGFDVDNDLIQGFDQGSWGTLTID